MDSLTFLDSPIIQPDELLLHSPTHSQSVMETSSIGSPVENHISDNTKPDAIFTLPVGEKVNGSSYNFRKRTRTLVPSSPVLRKKVRSVTSKLRNQSTVGLLDTSSNNKNLKKNKKEYNQRQNKKAHQEIATPSKQKYLHHQSHKKPTTMPTHTILLTKFSKPLK
jgi:hypothetical protein